MTNSPTTYFAVPDHYTIGARFDTFAQAEDHARSTIEEIRGCPGSFTRAFVDERVKDGEGDRPVKRTEVFLIDVRVENHESIFLFGLLTPRATEWVNENVSDEAQYFGRKLAVDHRYALDLTQGMIDAGLEVR